MNMRYGYDYAWQCIGWLMFVWFAILITAIVPNCFAGTGEKQLVHLYFADAKRPFLVAEARVAVNAGIPLAFGRQLVLELINGSSRGNLATIPVGTKLRSFFLLEDGTAVVDFSAQLRNNHPGSCRLEQLTLFSIVNSLILNVAEIDQVKILIDGAETHTLTGHLSLEFPLTADMLLTR